MTGSELRPTAPAMQKRLDAWVDHVEDVLTNKYERGCALANAANETRYRSSRAGRDRSL